MSNNPLSPPAAPPPRAGRVFHAHLRIELDVTPRWFAVPPPDKYNAGILFEDLADIGRVLSSVETVTRLFAIDVSVGQTGVRLVLMVPAEQPTDGFEAERRAVVAALDALDGVHPRRRRVTEGRARVAAERVAAEKQAQEAAAAPTPPAPPAPPPAPEPAPEIAVTEESVAPEGTA